MFKKLQEEVRDKIKSGKSLEAINYLCENVNQFSTSDVDDIIVARADFANCTLNYKRGQISVSDYNIFLNKFNYRLLELITRLSSNDEGGNKTRIETTKNREYASTARIVLFDENRIIMALTEFNQLYDIVFVTSYTKNKLFVKGENIEDPVKDNIFNLFKYSRKIPFEIDTGSKVITYRLYIKFSIYSGLITQFMLVCQDKILLESEL